MTVISSGVQAVHLATESFTNLWQSVHLCGVPGWNLERGPFCIYKSVVNRKKINERTEVFVLLKQKKLEQKKKNESLTNMDVTLRTKLIDFKSPFFAGDLKPYR